MINKVTLIGRVGQDPDFRVLESGVEVARFSVATSESYKDKDGNWQQTTEWHNVIVWRDLATRAKDALKKGGLVYVEGKISYRKYKDSQGVEKNLTDIVASTFRNLEKREKTEAGFPENGPPAPPRAAQPEPPANIRTTSELPPPPESDDLPF